MNNKYKLTFESPLLKSGIKIETEVDEQYVVPVLQKTMLMIREYNQVDLNVDTKKLNKVEK